MPLEKLQTEPNKLIYIVSVFSVVRLAQFTHAKYKSNKLANNAAEWCRNADRRASPCQGNGTSARRGMGRALMELLFFFCKNHPRSIKEDFQWYTTPHKDQKLHPGPWGANLTQAPSRADGETLLQLQSRRTSTDGVCQGANTCSPPEDQSISGTGSHQPMFFFEWCTQHNILQRDYWYFFF